MADIDVENADEDLVRAALTFCIRADRFDDGALASFAEGGYLDRLLKRLQEIG